MVLPTPLTPTQAEGAGDSDEIPCLFLEGVHVGKTLLVSLTDPDLEQALLENRVVIPGPLSSGPSPIEPESMFIVSVDPTWAFNQDNVVVAATIDHLVAGAVLRIAGLLGENHVVEGNVLTATFQLSSVEDVGVSTIGVYLNNLSPVPEHEIEFEIVNFEPAPPPAPGNVSVPVVSGTAQVGQTLTTTDGTWTNDPTSFVRQWLADGAAIAGATGAAYIPVTEDVGKVISCRVSATNAGGTTDAASAPTSPVIAAAPPATTAPYFRFIPLNSNDALVTVGNIEAYAQEGGPNELQGGTSRAQFTTANTTTEGTNTNWTDGASNTVVTNVAGYRDEMRLTYHRPGSPFSIRRMKMTPGNATVSQKRAAPTAWIVRRSPDNVVYETVDFITTGLWTDALDEAAREFDVGDQPFTTGLGRANARGWGISILGTVSATNSTIGNLIFASTPGGPTLCTGGSPMGSRAWPYGTAFNDRSTFRAFDGDAATRWTGVNGNFPHRLGYGRKTPLGDIAEVRVQASTQAAELGGMPTSFDVWYTEDFVNRIVVATIADQPGWGSGEIRAFPV